MAAAIADAEAQSPAELKLIRWRSGSQSVVTLTLRTMGAYAATAPYNCPKSEKILEEATPPENVIEEVKASGLRGRG